MPRLSRLAIRAALVYLLLGFTFGVLMLLNKGTPLASWAWRLLPAHVEFLLIGWTAQFILGVGFWILPRFSRGPARGNQVVAGPATGAVKSGGSPAGIAPVLN